MVAGWWPGERWVRGMCRVTEWSGWLHHEQQLEQRVAQRWPRCRARPVPAHQPPHPGASPAGMVGLAFFVTGLSWSRLALLLSNRAELERAGPGWQLLTKTGLQGFSQA